MSSYFASELLRIVNGGSWHGPSLRELLEGIETEQALAYPLEGRHSIWEIVNHLIVWHNVVARRINGEVTNPADEEDWPPVRESGKQFWAKALKILDSSAEEVARAIDSVSETKMNQTVPGTVYPYSEMIAGLPSHDACHAGQISFLKKILKESGK